ncbi:unnamed protein product [Rotaria magnacalcarata]|uniref:Uncharacterized protein n=1 Tax=Rotaria magnacalcarata TaxID=392030 RepID=A0A816Y6W1_9BILA|nr:unnamed protein product [Rotaria magnacalcarata]CAF2152176.1 unnamed protein product [Rotaria magnacalcarata]CAF2155449.1 unnamed protein product [Rotaria magnacalcarata]CAF4363899.1 unnamed protein product [Rotaria magnacalcarata]CAF4440951.1 unnamed protein product [Rotaria magnacalcarata]
MDACSACSSPDRSTNENIRNAENIGVTDADMKELENLLPCAQRTITDHELHLKKVRRQVLQHPCGAISTLSLMKKFDRDAATLLVEECLLLFTNDLFEVYSQLDPEGYIKYIPNTIDLVLISRLLHYEVDPSLYFQDIDIPEV